MHNLKMTTSKNGGTTICLDDFKLEGITSYNLKSPGNGVTELTITLIVKSQVEIESV